MGFIYLDDESSHFRIRFIWKLFFFFVSSFLQFFGFPLSVILICFIHLPILLCGPHQDDDEATPLLGHEAGPSSSRKFLWALVPIDREEWSQCGVLWKIFLICKVRPGASDKE